jgi:hypothetical protein
MDFLHVCLDAARDIYHPRDLAEYRAMAPSIARPILHRLGQDRLWASFVYDRLASLEHLCYFALLEGMEADIVQWCLMSVPATHLPSGWYGAEHDRWRGSLLRALLRAHVALGAGSADAAIRCLFHVLELKDGMKRQQVGADFVRPDGDRDCSLGGWMISLKPATLELHAALTQGRCPQTSALSFQNFAAWHRGFTHRTNNQRLAGAASLQLDVATLQMYHPTDPNEHEFVSLLRKILGDGTRGTQQAIDDLLSDGDGTFLLPQVQRAHLVATLQGRERNVAFLERHFSDRVDGWTWRPRREGRTARSWAGAL